MNLKKYFKNAKRQNWAIGQFNFSTVEQLRGILAAAKNLKSPLILGTSEGESKYLGVSEIIALVEILKKEYSLPSIFLNLDHGKNLNWIKRAIDYGYDVVHFDGSRLSLAENIKKTKEIVKYAHKKDVFVEAELGVIKGESEIHKRKIKIEEKDLTSPLDVAKFINETQIDSLAVAIGNIHGLYSERPKPKLDFERLKEINKKAKGFLVLHGGSGIQEKDIRKAIDFGIVKINFNTELRLVWKSSLEKSLEEIEESAPYKILPQVQNAIQKKVEEKIILIGSKNKK